MNFFPKKRLTEAEDIEVRAAVWLAQEDAGMTSDDLDKFEAWRAADSRHAAALHRLEQTWMMLHSLREYRPTARTFPDPDLLSPRRNPSLSRFSRAAVALPFAAVLAFAAVWWWSAETLNREAPVEQVFATTVGGYQRVALEDGSVVELNSSTDLRVHFSARERRVELLRGEAHFTVVKNPRRPFLVAADGVTVRAVGTAFDVRIAPKGIEVLVTAGTVQLGRTTSASIDHAAGTDRATRFVTAGWRALVTRAEAETPVVEKMASPVVRDLLAWQSSRLVFVEMPLGEVIEQFNQRNDVQLSLADPELAKMAVGGSFAANNVEAFVRLLSSNGDLTAEQVGADRIVLRKAH